MAKVKVNINAGRITARLRTEIGRALKQAGIENIAKEEMINSIRGTGILSKPTLPSGERVKSITPQTVRNRRRIASRNATHPDFSPKKSNLTLTGELLDKGIKATFSVSKLLIDLSPKKGTHNIYKVSKKRKKGKRSKSSYADIFKGQSEQGRSVFVLGDKFLKRIQRKVIAEVRRILR